MILKHIHTSERWPDFRTGCRTREDIEQLVRYLQRKAASPEILRNDFVGSTPAEIADELMALQQGQPVVAYHIVASYPKDEAPLWQPQSKKRIQEVQDTFQITKGFWVQHKGHWHVVLCAMRPKGGQVRLATRDEDGNSIPVARAFRLMAERWEDETPGARKTGRSGKPDLHLSHDSIAMAERQYLTGQAPTPIPKKLLLRSLVEKLVTQSHGMEQLHQLAAASGVEIQYKRDPSGKILGISFSQDGTSLRGREAGYSYPALLKLYEHTPTNTTTPPSIGRHPHVAGRPIDPSRRKGHPGDSARDAAPDTNTGNPRSTANQSGRAHPVRPQWLEAAVRALKPRNQTLMDLLIDLTETLTRIASQGDSRRRSFYRPRTEIPPL